AGVGWRHLPGLRRLPAAGEEEDCEEGGPQGHASAAAPPASGSTRVASPCARSARTVVPCSSRHTNPPTVKSTSCAACEYSAYVAAGAAATPNSSTSVSTVTKWYEPVPPGDGSAIPMAPTFMSAQASRKPR